MGPDSRRAIRNRKTGADSGFEKGILSTLKIGHGSAQINTDFLSVFIRVPLYFQLAKFLSLDRALEPFF